MAAAATTLQNQDFRGAVTLLEPKMRTLQNQAVAWRTLGLAHLRLHESSAAREAYLKTLALEPNDPRPFLCLGVAAAQDGHIEQAFEWLRKAKESRRIDMWQLDIEPDLQALRGEPRYSVLPPQPEDFANPFVEGVNIIRESDGEAAGDRFGWIARVIGDVDGDGVNDFVTCAPSKNIGGENAGRVYVYSGGTGALLWSMDGARRPTRHGR